MSFITRFFRKRLCVVLFLFGFTFLLSSNGVSQNIQISVESTSGRPGEKQIPLNIRITTTQDTLIAFELWLQLNRPDIITFEKIWKVTVEGSFIPTWWVWGTSVSGTYTEMDINGYYPIPEVSQFIFPPVANEILFKCFVDVADGFEVPPIDSVVVISVNTEFLDNFSLTNQNGTIIERSTIEVIPGTFTLLPACGYNDGIYDISKLVSLVDFMFYNGPNKNLAQADCNCDCNIDIADLVSFVSYMFGGGLPPGCGK